MYTEVVSNAELKVFTVSAHLFTVKSQQSFIYTTVWLGIWAPGEREQASSHQHTSVHSQSNRHTIVQGGEYQERAEQRKENNIKIEFRGENNRSKT